MFRPSLQKRKIPESTNREDAVNKQTEEEREVKENYDDEERRREFPGKKWRVRYLLW